jgi:hypothetical protein
MPRMGQRAFLLPLMLLATLSAAQPADRQISQAVTDHSYGCHGLKGGEVHKALGNGYALNIRPAPPEMEALCWAEVSDNSGAVLYEVNDFAVGLHDATGKDINGDGKPDVVIEASSGGARCCLQYAIVSLDPPRVLARLHNAYAIDFNEIGGRVILSTQDGAFDFFQGFYEPSPRADVFLRFDGNKLEDVSSEFRDEYDQQIAKARQRLTKPELDQFRTAGPSPQKPEVHAAVVTIVVEYLYSGREQQAWQTFGEMWPAATQQRVKQLILDTRARGLASQLGRNGKSQP